MTNTCLTCKHCINQTALLGDCTKPVKPAFGMKTIITALSKKCDNYEFDETKKTARYSVMEDL